MSIYVSVTVIFCVAIIFSQLRLRSIRLQLSFLSFFVAPYYEKRHFRIVKFSAIFYMSPFVVFLCTDKPGSIQLCRSVNYPHLKKQASEEDSLNTQASNPQVLSFPTYPGDILCHVYERDPVARQATPVFRR